MFQLNVNEGSFKKLRIYTVHKKFMNQGNFKKSSAIVILNENLETLLNIFFHFFNDMITFQKILKIAADKFFKN